jgi:hypothetical protein
MTYVIARTRLVFATAVGSIICLMGLERLLVLCNHQN